MAPKPKPNGFYIYMKEQQARIRKETGIAHSMNEMPRICQASWKSMSTEERKMYDQKAKSLKNDLTIEANSKYRRRDNQRQFIDKRVDPVKEEERRRKAECQKMKAAWASQDLKNLKFYIINFNVMYIDLNVEHRMPLEIGMICITMRDGVVKDMHRFINPGEAPEGFRGLAMAHSEATHQIPFNFEHADSNYSGLWKQIEEFVSAEDDTEIPPIFCLSPERADVETCLDFIHASAGAYGPNKLHKVYCLEDLASSLIILSKEDSPEPSNTQIRDTLQQNRWDYRSDIRCHYHEEMDCAHCSLSIVKRYSYALFDTLAGLMDIKLTSSHLPDETEINNNVFHPPVAEPAWDKNAPTYVTKRFSGLSIDSPSEAAMFVEKKIPIVSRVTIQLSGSDSSDSGEEEDDTVLYTEEVRSTVDQYSLRQLRLPKTTSIAQAATKTHINNQEGVLLGGRGSTVAALLSERRPGQLDTRQPSRPAGVSVGRGVLIGRGRAAPALSDVSAPARLVPMGRGLLGMGMGRGIAPKVGK